MEICIDEEDIPEDIFREMERYSDDGKYSFLVFRRTEKGLHRKEICGDEDVFIDYVDDEIERVKSDLDGEDFDKAARRFDSLYMISAKLNLVKRSR